MGMATDGSFDTALQYESRSVECNRRADANTSEPDTDYCRCSDFNYIFFFFVWIVVCMSGKRSVVVQCYIDFFSYLFIYLQVIVRTYIF